ncbi:MAG: hypothetical protein K5858_09625 [Lachnospiraceae bacterium]|jgi:flagellar FliL protein|nr:hypothetical protein [Lachnospiraceae bacterium]
MKKNMLTVVVIALCILNLALTAMVVFSVVPTVKATNNLISQVASIIDLELESPDPKYTVSMSDLTAVEFAGTLTINLKKVEGEKNDPFAIIDSVTVYLNSKGEDYADLNTNLANYSTTISEIVTDNFAKYTKDEAQNNRDLIKDEILKQLQKRFETQTIADISFKNLRFQ